MFVPLLIIPGVVVLDFDRKIEFFFVVDEFFLDFMVKVMNFVC